MAAKKPKKYVVATATVHTVMDNGVPFTVHRGDTYESDHPAVKRTGVFVSQDEWARMNGTLVESASAAPGEVRNVTPPKAAKK